MDITLQGLVEYANSKVGQPYWYGTNGQIASQSLLKRLQTQSWTKGYYSQWYVDNCNKEMGQQVFDCVGLLKAYCMGVRDNYEADVKSGIAKYIGEYDKSADGWLSECTNGSYTIRNLKGLYTGNNCAAGTIDTMPDTPGISVHLPGHVGIYVGNGMVIDCRGKSSSARNKLGLPGGVVKTPLSSMKWTHWGKAPWFNDSIIQNTTQETGGINMEYILKDTMNIRKTPNGTDIGDVPKGTKIGALDIKNDKGKDWAYIVYTSGGKTINGWVCVAPEFADKVEVQQPPVVQPPVQPPVVDNRDQIISDLNTVIGGMKIQIDNKDLRISSLEKQLSDIKSAYSVFISLLK